MAQKIPGPRHGTTKRPADIRSESQADGTAADAPRGEAGNPESSGSAQQHSTVGTPKSAGGRSVQVETPENRTASVEPSSATQAAEGGQTTKPSTRPRRDDSLSDSAGEVGGADIHKLGHITVDSTEPKAPSSGSSPEQDKPGKRADKEEAA